MDLWSAIEPGSGLFRLLSGFLLPAFLGVTYRGGAGMCIYIDTSVSLWGKVGSVVA